MKTSKFIYRFLFNGSVCESAASTVSVHRTKKGAYKAMNKFLNDEFNEKREYWGREFRFQKPFWDCWYGVKSIELKD